MALIEGFRVQNYRALRDVTLGKLSSAHPGEPLTPLTVVIGKNGVGKTTIFDAFGFLADCLAHDVETACDMRGRGGFDRLRSAGVTAPITFEIAYHDPGHLMTIYEVAIDVDASKRPYVLHEIMSQPLASLQGEEEEPVGDDGGVEEESLYPFLKLEEGYGRVWTGEDVVSANGTKGSEIVHLTDPRQLAVATLGTLEEHPRIQRFRDFLKGWFLSYFHPDAARGLPSAGPQRHLNMSGDNLANVVQFMERDHPARFKDILGRIAKKIPGIDRISTTVSVDRRVLLQFNDSGFTDPFYAQQMSDGTLKLFAYLLLLEDPDPPPFICIEEPENGLYHKLLDALVHELRARANGEANAPQVFVTTHQPYLVDALTPEEVWILEKGPDGFSQVTRASSLEIVRNLVAEGLPLGGLWYSDYLDAR